MHKKTKYLLNKTQHEEHDLPCVKCAGKTTHKVLTSVDARGSDGDFGWATDYQIVQCLGCKTVSFRQASSNSEDYFYTNDEEIEYEVLECLYPSRIDGIKGLGEEIHYLPFAVRKIYEETLQALSSQYHILAAIGLRALLEAVCKEKEASGRDLLNKIDSLVIVGILGSFVN